MMGGSTQRGTFVVGFTVHEAKELSKEGRAVDAVCVIRCLDRVYTTEVQYDKLQYAKFGDSYIWGDILLTEDEFRMTYLDFEVQSANVIFRNDVIGSGKVQLSMVRMRSSHSYNNKWLELRNEENAITAKLLVSVNCIGEGDLAAKPDEDGGTGGAADTEEQLKDLKKVLLQDKQDNTELDDHRQAYHLFVHIHRAENLGGFTKGDISPYIVVDFNGCQLQTEPCPGTNSVNFNECFRIPVLMPIFADAIAIRIWNSNWGKDMILVQGRLSFSLLRMHAMKPRWFNFYGFSEDEVGDLDFFMSHAERPEENFFVGRLLISGRVQRVDSLKMLKHPGRVAGMPFEEPASSVVHMLVDVFEVSGCSGIEVYVTASIGKVQQKTKRVERQPNGRFHFSDGGRGRMKAWETIMCMDEVNQTDIIISIHANVVGGTIGEVAGWHRVGFKRLKLKDVRQWKGEMTSPTWLSMNPMPHLPSSIMPGQMLVCLAWSPEMVKDRGFPTCDPIDFELRCYCFMARNLDSQSGEVPCAFVELCCAGETERTQTYPFSGSPQWQKLVTMQIQLQRDVAAKRVYPEPIQVAIYDDIVHKELDMEAELAKRAQQATDAAGQVDTTGLGGVLSVDDDKAKRLHRWAARQAATVPDYAGAIAGNVMAKKRLGAVSGGRRLIGRVVVDFRRFLRLPRVKEGAMRPKWLRVRGGQLGAKHVGDVLMGFQLMKRKYATIYPEESLQPQGRLCLISLAFLGLRDVRPVNGEQVQTPALELEVLQPCAPEGDEAAVPQPLVKQITYRREPREPLAPGDHNRKFKMGGNSGYEFLMSEHIEARLPKNPVFESIIRVRLFAITKSQVDKKAGGRSDDERASTARSDDGSTLDGASEKGSTKSRRKRKHAKKDHDLPDEDLIGEGLMTLGDMLPWCKTKKSRKLREANDHFHLDTSEEDDDKQADGVYVSSDEEMENAAYETIEADGNTPLNFTFQADHKTGDGDRHFPPTIATIETGSPLKGTTLKAGDWLVGYAGEEDGGREHVCYHWHFDRATEELKGWESKKIKLRFRRNRRQDVAVRIYKGQNGLLMEKDDESKPPMIKKDISLNKIWKKLNVGKGFVIVDINGFNTSMMTFETKEFQALWELRPCVITCNMGAGTQGSITDKALQETKEITLAGLPSRYIKAKRDRMAPRDTCLKHSRAPRPTAFLMPLLEARHMNLRVAQGSLIDVQGTIKEFGDAQDDDGDMNTRPSVLGNLEDSMPASDFDKIKIMNGDKQVGLLKLRVRIVSPPMMNWWDHTSKGQVVDRTVFDETKFRKRYKVDIPTSVRVRTYIVRGLGVSGFRGGCGNPYPFFMYGDQPVHMRHKVIENTSEPRFFCTEERDVQLPDQAYFEVGFNDLDKTFGSDGLIGKSIIDLEDRYYNRQFQEYMKANAVPIEYRNLLTEGAGGQLVSKGNLEMWMEIVATSMASEVPTSPLYQPPPVEVELRVVVFGCRRISRRVCVDENGEQRETVDVMSRVALLCPTFQGPQPLVQESDWHYGCSSDAEFNWRYVWSRIQVTRGVPIDCRIQMSLVEKARFRQSTLCEGVLDMRPYCKKVALMHQMISVGSELPLSNPELTLMIKDDVGSGAFALEQDALRERVGRGGGEALPEQDAHGAEGGKYDTSAALVMTLVQVYSQTHASDRLEVVGLGRQEPNRKPALTYPSTGRDWKAQLPFAAAALNAGLDAMTGAKRRCIVYTAIIAVVAFYYLLNYIPGPDMGCPVPQRSCKARCPACEYCFAKGGFKINTGDETWHCYSMITGSYPAGCVSGIASKTYCNIGDSIKAEVASNGCHFPDGVAEENKCATVTTTSSR